ncbi:MAG: DUF7482 domain-containing protein [Thermomicrobiales bacterium]
MIVPQRDRALSRRTVLGAGVGLGTALTVGRNPFVLAQESTPGADEARAVVADVVEFTLDPEGRWPGPFSSVTLQLHPGWFDGGDAWFIRTDASDPEFAEAEGLVYVPLLANALNAEGSYASLYRFADGAEGQRPVLSTVPGGDDFTPAFQIVDVSFSGDPELLDSAAAIEEAATAGTVTLEPSGIIVNYPLVVWPDGGLAVDPDLEMPLGPGPLVEEPDLENGTVTFKLHQCYPGSRYIATDTSAVPMAPMMGVVGSAPTQALIEANGTAPIYVFGNGLAGPGPMGFQPSVFNASAGDPVWSPFWEHFVVMWKDPEAASVLQSEAEIMEAVETGTVELFTGTPDTHPDGFVVNCPSPVLAPNTYDPATFAASTT